MTEENFACFLIFFAWLGDSLRLCRSFIVGTAIMLADCTTLSFFLFLLVPVTWAWAVWESWLSYTSNNPHIIISGIVCLASLLSPAAILVYRRYNRWRRLKIFSRMQELENQQKESITA